MFDGDYGVDDWFRNGYIDMCLSAVLSVKKKNKHLFNICYMCAYNGDFVGP